MKLKISAIVALIGLSLSALGLGRLLNREEINSFVPDGKLYSMPEMKKKPRKFWTCTGVVSIDNRNSINETETIQSHGTEIGLLPSASVDNDFRQYDIIIRTCQYGS